MRQIKFTITELEDSSFTMRLVAENKAGEVFAIHEGTLRSCLNRQFEILREEGITNLKMRIRLD